MEKLIINKMDNAFGIGRLSINIDDNNKLYQHIIYSRNGTFKSSFARTLYNVSNGNLKEIRDRIAKVPAALNISIENENGTILTNFENKFVVFSRDIYETNYKKLSDYTEEYRLIAISVEDKQKLDKILSENLKVALDELKANCNNIGLNFEKTIDVLDCNSNNMMDKLINIFQQVANIPNHDISKINLKKIFQKAYDVIDNKDFKKNVDEYVEVYNNRLNEELFDSAFNENNCLDLISYLKKSSFLSREKRRGIIIMGEPYYKIDKIEVLLDSAIRQVSNDPEIIKANKEFIKKIGTTNESESLKEDFLNNPQLVKQLSLGRKNIILAALKNNGIQYNLWLEKLNNTKKELEKLLENVKSKKSIFEDALSIYIRRFHPVFDIKIDNKEESLLGLQVPTFIFNHKRNNKVKMDEEELYDLLSSGEKTALNIIKFLVEYLANKSNKPFIILDDIVETFDYANRYAFIEYINDLVKADVPIIVLTHNFEFFRTLSIRVRALKRLEAISTDDGTVYIRKNTNLGKNIEKILCINSIEQFLFSIPYVREVNIILRKNTNNFDKLLHYNKEIKNFTLGQVKDLLGDDAKIDIEIDENDNYLETLKRVTNRFKDIDNSNLVNKTILSMYLRVILEEKIIQDNYDLLSGINEFQLAKIKEKYSDRLSEKTNLLIEKIQLLTPEFIHGNAFMYEPLIDIDVRRLLEVKKELDNLDIKGVWKYN